MSGVTIEPHKKQLHVSLAYQFPTEKKEKLETLAKAINLQAPVRWDLRLYSRDVLKGKGNYQVWFTFNSISVLPCTFDIITQSLHCTSCSDFMISWLDSDSKL